MKNQFVNTLPSHIQEEIAKDIIQALTNEGLTQDEIQEGLENALCSRLHDLSDTININKYL